MAVHPFVVKLMKKKCHAARIRVLLKLAVVYPIAADPIRLRNVAAHWEQVITIVAAQLLRCTLAGNLPALIVRHITASGMVIMEPVTSPHVKTF